MGLRKAISIGLKDIPLISDQIQNEVKGKPYTPGPSLSKAQDWSAGVGRRPVYDKHGNTVGTQPKVLAPGQKYKGWRPVK